MGHKIDKNHFMATFMWISSSTSSDQLTAATLFLFKSKLLFQVCVSFPLFIPSSQTVFLNFQMGQT